MKNLKDLTQEECVKIAQIINPKIDWEFYISKHRWNGFDIIEKSEMDITTYDSWECVQIDLDFEHPQKLAFKHFKDLEEVRISDFTFAKIFYYLESLQQNEQVEI
jgi:hypothetical protein